MSLRMSRSVPAFLFLATGLTACFPNLKMPKKIQLNYASSSTSGSTSEPIPFDNGDSNSARVTFDDANENIYTYDTESIEIVNGIARLKAIPDTATTQSTDSGGLPPPDNAGAVHYSNIQPTIYQNRPLQFRRLLDMTEVEGPAGCPGGIRYTVSMEQVVWFYFNGYQWLPSDGSVVQASTLSQLKEGFPLLASMSNQDFYIRFHLISMGDQPCELDQVSISGSK